MLTTISAAMTRTFVPCSAGGGPYWPACGRRDADGAGACPVKGGRVMGLEGPMAAGHGHPVAGGGQGEIRAADTDRDRVAGILSTAYSEGRLSSDEYDARLESALSARTYADLDHIVTDLPVAQKTVPSPAARPW